MLLEGCLKPIRRVTGMKVVQELTAMASPTFARSGPVCFEKLSVSSFGLRCTSGLWG